MKILLCSIPDTPLNESTNPILSKTGGNPSSDPWMPTGLLRVDTWIQKHGYNADIYDISNLRPTDDELIKNFEKYKPDVVGLGSPLSWCYGNLKRISKIIRNILPDAWIIVGGHLTSSANVILNKTGTDICILGDGEIPFLKILEYIKLNPNRSNFNSDEFEKIKGLAFLNKKKELIVTGYADQLNSSEMNPPNYDKLSFGLEEFGGHKDLIYQFFPEIEVPSDHENLLHGEQTYPYAVELYKKLKGKRMAKIDTSRGCVARCTFCQRATKSYRTYSSNDLESHVIELKEKYNVGGLLTQDENFGSNKKHSYEVAKMFKKHDLLWLVNNARVTSFSYEDLKFYRDHNMILVNFGIESGSQKILDIMEKKVSKSQLYKTLANCKKAGVKTHTQNMIIGMPGENRDTVIASGNFNASLRHLLGLDWNLNNTHMAIAVPGTPLYEYSQQIGVIGKSLEDEEDYLIGLTESNPGGGTRDINYLNKTNQSAKEVFYWTYLYRYAGKKAFVDLILKDKKSKSLVKRLSEIYKKCVWSTWNAQLINYRARKVKFKNISFLKKIKHIIFPAIHWLFSLYIILVPKKILFTTIKLFSDIQFTYLKMIKNRKLNEKDLKYTFFANINHKSFENLRLNDIKIEKIERSVEKSLRQIVFNNREILNHSITAHEKGIQEISQGQ